MLAVAVSLAAAAGGCTKTLVVDRYPRFYDPKLKTVAVLPFDSTARYRHAGRLLAHHLAAALTANRSYTVIGPDRLRGMLGGRPGIPTFQGVADFLRDRGCPIE